MAWTLAAPSCRRISISIKGPPRRQRGRGWCGWRKAAATVDTGAYDVVICDPPKLAPSVKDLPRATRKYKQLNSGAIEPSRRKEASSCLTCSAMTQSGGFVKMLHEAAQQEGRALTLLRVSGAARKLPALSLSLSLSLALSLSLSLSPCPEPHPPS